MQVRMKWINILAFYVTVCTAAFLLNPSKQWTFLFVDLRWRATWVVPDAGDVMYQAKLREQ